MKAIECNPGRIYTMRELRKARIVNENARNAAYKRIKNSVSEILSFRNLLLTFVKRYDTKGIGRYLEFIFSSFKQ